MEKKLVIRDPYTKRPERGLTLIIIAEERGPEGDGPVDGIIYPFTSYLFLLIREVPVAFVEISAVLAINTQRGHCVFIRIPVHVVNETY